MKREDIKKASVNAIHENYRCNGQHPCTERNYCIFCNGNNSAFDCCECGADEFNEGFIAGSEWRINSVWHTYKEIPKEPFAILAIRSDDSIEVVYFTNIDHWKSLIKRCGFVKWAYIKDLIPNTED